MFNSVPFTVIVLIFLPFLPVYRGRGSPKTAPFSLLTYFLSAAGSRRCRLHCGDTIR
nr:MAG TPA: hypothetical protein [Caudoviricetes sp.]DAV15620.1 MAG TPA: hypothetical protein [Caudoviricetes sp.]